MKPVIPYDRSRLPRDLRPFVDEAGRLSRYRVSPAAAVTGTPYPPAQFS